MEREKENKKSPVLNICEYFHKGGNELEKRMNCSEKRKRKIPSNGREGTRPRHGVFRERHRV